jgi:D-glycero-alpha-D-manno-heptose-7-phosphate kinase
MESRTNHLPILDENGKIIDVRFRVEAIKSEAYPQISGKAPLRISFAGGGTDKQDFFEEHGGVVLNATIDKYCHATIKKRADPIITIDSDMGDRLRISSIRDISYDGKYNLAKAIIRVLNPDFGFDVHAYNDVPPGRGLGSSATFAVLVAKLISQLQGKEYNDYKLAEMAYDAERKELGIGGGWQDQYAAATGGFNYMEFNKDGKLVYPLRLKPEIVSELEDHLTMGYVGNAHNSGELHKSQDRALVERREEVTQTYAKMKQHATEVRDCLLMRNIPRIGEILHEAWESKKRIDPSITNPVIDRMYAAGISNGAYGGKLLGAGGGGYLLFFHPATKRNRVARAFSAEGGEIMDFNFETQGTQTWFSRSEY